MKANMWALIIGAIAAVAVVVGLGVAFKIRKWRKNLERNSSNIQSEIIALVTYQSLAE